MYSMQAAQWEKAFPGEPVRAIIELMGQGLSKSPARAFDADRQLIDTFRFEIMHMEQNPQTQQDLALALGELLKLMRENSRRDLEEDFSRKHGGLAKQVRVNIWAICVMAGSVLISVGALYQRVATLETQVQQSMVASADIREVRVKQEAFQTELRRQMDRLEAELDGGRKGK